MCQPAAASRLPVTPADVRSFEQLRLFVHVALCRKENLLEHHFPMTELELDADHIRVIVRDGVVTLRGSVEDQNAFDAATANALEGGAKKVVNLLTVEKKG